MASNFERDGIEVTEDAFLGGRVTVRQPVAGPRAGIDPVLLAAAVPALAGQRVLDVGSGSGVAACCLAGRVRGLAMVGLEIDADMAALARQNARLNGLDGGPAGDFQVVEGDLATGGAHLGDFDHVMTNPPFAAPGTGTVPPHGIKAKAHVESAVNLDQWLQFCLRMTRPRGTVTIIHRADRLDQILHCLWGKAGDVRVLPLWPRAGSAARRVLVQARPAVSTPLALLPGLVLHRPDSRDFTVEAEAILRHGEALALEI